MRKSTDKNKAAIDENRGLHVKGDAKGIKLFFHRYTSPVSYRLSQGKMGNTAQTLLVIIWDINRAEKKHQGRVLPVIGVKGEKQ